MKIEKEISEQEITDAIDRKVRMAIDDQINQWSADEFIRTKVNENWKVIAEALVVEILKNSDDMQERKLKIQITALMKVN
jgi:hypothetical protein